MKNGAIRRKLPSSPVTTLVRKMRLLPGFSAAAMSPLAHAWYGPSVNVRAWAKHRFYDSCEEEEAVLDEAREWLRSSILEKAHRLMSLGFPEYWSWESTPATKRDFTRMVRELATPHAGYEITLFDRNLIRKAGQAAMKLDGVTVHHIGNLISEEWHA